MRKSKLIRVSCSLAAFLVVLALPAVAADISGKWTFAVETSAGSGTPIFTFQQNGEKLTGSYAGALGEAKLEGTVKGDKVEFQFEIAAEGQKLKVSYTGAIESPTRMKGTGKYDQLGDATWTATKN